MVRAHREVLPNRDEAGICLTLRLRIAGDTPEAERDIESLVFNHDVDQQHFLITVGISRSRVQAGSAELVGDDDYEIGFGQAHVFCDLRHIRDRECHFFGALDAKPIRDRNIRNSNGEYQQDSRQQAIQNRPSVTATAWNFRENFRHLPIDNVSGNARIVGNTPLSGRDAAHATGTARLYFGTTNNLKSIRSLQMSLDPLRRLWQSLAEKQQRFVANAFVAIVVLVALGFLDQSHWLLRLENTAMDTMMEFNKGLGRMSGTSGSDILQFTFLDIDEATYRLWDEPHHTPRDKILRLVDFAASSDPSLIVVDIDLSKPGVNPDHDLALANYLSGYGAAGSTPIILVRSFYSGTPGKNDWDEIRPSFLDGYELPESVHWGQPLFQTTLWDGVVRHWNLARFGCFYGRPVLVPSIQLTAAALLSDQPAVNRVADIEAIGLESCLQRDENSLAADSDSDFTFETGIGQRLVFTIPWRAPAPDLVTIPASVVTESADALAGDLVRGRVVVIGASFAGSNDIHRTPIGEMPGALIIVNAIKSLVVFGQLREPPTWITWLQQLGVIILAAWAFSRFDSFVAVGITAAIIVALLMPISFYFFKYGLWVGFSIPLLAMVIHRGFAEYRDVRRQMRSAATSAGTKG